MFVKAEELFDQLQKARKLKFIRGIDCLVLTNAQVFNTDRVLFSSIAESAKLPSSTTKIYVRFDARVSREQVVEIKKYVETNYGFKCAICEWSIPTRLDILLDINI